jgi:choline-sulfatase
MREDPDELIDLGESKSHADIRAQCHRQMLSLVEPEAANKKAFADQAAKIEELGGTEALMSSEQFDFTPVES